MKLAFNTNENFVRKKILYASYLILAVCIFISCEKIPSHVYTIEGYIYEDCSMTPYANADIELYQEIETGLSFNNSTGGILATTTTDANGYFKFTYTPENNYEVLIQNGGNAIIGVPTDTNINDLFAYYFPTCNIQVSLNVINAYGEGDTLYITDFGALEDNLPIVGPFFSGILYTAKDVNLIGMNYTATQEEIIWYVNNPDNYVRNYIQINQYCSDTTYVIIDIY